MSETVEVPVDTLKQLASSYHNYSDNDPYAVTSAMPSYIVDLVALIPVPLKVGDSITGGQFAALPPRSVAIDSDGDVWVSTNEGDATLVQKKSVYASHEDIITDDGVYITSDMGRGTLVHIGWSDEVL